MSQLKPTDAFGELFYSVLTEEQETWYDDGYDDGYEQGYRAALVEAVGVVTALFVAHADADAEDDA